MKIGRNDLCPCGSGKKYKKCCLYKRHQNDPLFDYDFLNNCSSNFDYITPIAFNIYNAIKEYRFEDAVVAIFCLNLWRKNRSALAQSLSLNLALTMPGKFGNKRIESYADFENFYNQIAPFTQITYREDYTIDDFGEVFINHRNKTYPIITGNGYSQVYAAMRYMQTLSQLTNHDNELGVLLEYNELIISNTESTNLENYEQDIVFDLPTEAFWISVNNLFGNQLFIKQIQAVSCIMGYQKSPIEYRHFVEKNKKFYPLYNCSLLVDYYKILLNNSDHNIIKKHVTYTIHSIVENSYNFSNDTQNRALINPVLIDKTTNEKLVDKGVLFAGLNKENILIVIDNDIFDDNKDVDAIVNRFLECSNRELLLAEGYPRKENNGTICVNLDAKNRITFMIVNSYTDISSNYYMLGENERRPIYNSLDLLYMIGFSDDFGELIEFLNYHENQTAMIFSFGGMCNLFFAWKNANRNIFSGAKEFNNLSLDYNEAEGYTYQYFKEILSDFPKNGNSLFIDPLNWKAEKVDLGFTRIYHKGGIGFGGEVKKLSPELFIFIAKNVAHFCDDDFSQSAHTALNTSDELIQRLMLRYGKYLSNFSVLRNKTLQLLFIPLTYAKKKFGNKFLNDPNRTIVYSDKYIQTECVILRYSYDSEILLNAIQNASNRYSENTFFVELLTPLKKYDLKSFNLFEKTVFTDNDKKKTVGVFQIEQKYYFSDRSIDIVVSDISYTKVRKEIAKICFSAGIVPGKYHGKEATKTIRSMQNAAVQVFEKYISLYDKEELNKRILDYYAIQQNGVTVNYKRYLGFKDLDASVQEEFEHKTRNIREEYRKNAETAKYFLESNLVVERRDASKKCSKEDFEFLIGFANWLVVLQDNADTCHYTDLDLYIEVDSEYKINTVFEDDSRKIYDDILLRKYNTNDYHIKNDDEDAGFFQEAIQQFKNDTGIDFQLLILLLDYMQLGLIEDNVATEIYTNVFSVEKSALIEAFNSNLEIRIDDEFEISNIIDFITLNESLLKTLENKQTDILPIWDREKRDNRFDVKPLIIQNGNLVFTPVALSNLRTLWISGITDWYLPFEIGLPNLKSVLKSWKKRYEDEMVKDIAELFKHKGFGFVQYEVDLNKRFPKSGYPEKLGDYDVFAIDDKGKTIWIIESKVLQKVGSIYEDQMQQKSFFFQHKDDEKFQRRINYMNNNIAKILSSFDISISEYTIKSYMVTNKLFMSRYKTIDFPIVTFDEFNRILEEYRF